MSIRDLSKWPDHLVPAWVRQAREARREERKKTCPFCNEHFPSVKECEKHCMDVHKMRVLW